VSEEEAVEAILMALGLAVEAAQEAGLKLLVLLRFKDTVHLLVLLVA
jgi:hypothetical protein